MLKKLIFPVMCCAVMTQAAVEIARNGRPSADIVIARAAHPAVVHAAEELSRWIREISGAELPVLKKAGKAPLHIRLGAVPEGAAEDLKALQGNDGFAVRRRGDSVYLFGSRPKGVLNGVYRWLYKNTDIIWFRPNPDFGTVFTPCPTLVFQFNDYRDVPVYIQRGWQMNGIRHHGASEEWMVRNSCNWSAQLAYKEERLKYDPIFEYGLGHNLVGLYITEKKYFDAHPEYFPLINGKRRRFSELNGQLCFTNRELLQAFIRELEERIRKNPRYDMYRIMIEDNWNLCECPECMKPIVLPDGTTLTPRDGNFRSTQFFLWLNQIARHVKKHFPDKRLLSFGYFFTEIPPACEVESNISISLAPIYKNSKEDMTGPSNAATNGRFLGWIGRRANLILREYYGLVKAFPRPIDKIAMADWRYIHRYGVNRTYSEMMPDAVCSSCDGRRTWDMNAMYFWVITQGCWDPYRDYRELRQEFLTRTFGTAAANYVADFFQIIGEGWFRIGGASRWNDSCEASWRDAVNELGNRDRCRQALQRALNCNMHVNARRMLYAMLNTFEEASVQGKMLTLEAAPVDAEPPFETCFDKAPWSGARAAEHFYTAGKKPVSEKTEVRMLYDNRNLYVGARLFDHDMATVFADPPGRTKERWPVGDKLELCFNGPDGKIYQFAVDVNGNRYDAREHDPSWNPVYQCRVRKNSDSWSVMYAIPLNIMKIQPNSPQKVSVMFTRYLKHQRKNVEVSTWENGVSLSPGSYGRILFK